MPRHVAPGARPVQRLHRDAEAERLPVAAHHGHRPDVQRVEIQIRTKEMDDVAEHGIAAHWAYKEGKPASLKGEDQFAWLRQLMEWQRDLKDPTDFISTVKVDLFSDEVFVFTPAVR